MRICKLDGFDVEVSAEVEGGGIEGEAPDVSPKIKLITGSAASEASKEMAVGVHREATLVGVGLTG